jgi:RecA/RadA recombinase
MQGITEIAGEAGCGKTQTCLTLALQVSSNNFRELPTTTSMLAASADWIQVQLDVKYGGRGGAAAYLSCGEGIFPIRRLSQLAAAFETRTGVPSEQLLANVHIEQCYNIDDAQAILVGELPCV